MCRVSMYHIKPKEAERTVRAWEEFGVQLLKRNIEDARNGDETFRVGPLVCNDNGLQRRIGSDVVFKINVSAFKKAFRTRRWYSHPGIVSSFPPIVSILISLKASQGPPQVREVTLLAEQ